MLAVPDHRQVPPLFRTDITDLMRIHGIVPTRQRVEIANVLFSRCEHLSANQTLAVVNMRHSKTSRATVYDALKLFLKRGLVGR